MKKIYLGFIVIVMTATLNGLYAQVGVGTVSPFGALDVTSTNDGVLISRVALTATNVATVLTPTTSELVYNTATAGAGATAVTPGFYYWDGALWIKISTGQNSDWTLLGNSGTVAATNFVGTTDAIDFVTRTNNTEKTRVTSAGNVGIGTPTPAAKLDVATGATVVNNIVNATGSINDYLEFNIQNTSTGIQAQSGYNATADNGTATTGFAWFGINNSTFNFPTSYNIGGVNDVSLMGSGQDMYVANANNTKSIIFSTGRAVTPFFNERMRITNAGNIGIGTTLPTGLLDLTATDRGIVPPRIALTDSSIQAPVINPQGGSIPAGTTIYNTATAGVSPNNVGPGLYFWNGTRWVAFAGSAGGLDWSLTGNTGTVAATNFVGTTDAIDFVTRTNNLERTRVLSNGHVLVNTTTNTQADNLFEVVANIAGDDAITGTATGTLGRGVQGNSDTDGTGVIGFNSGAGNGVTGVNTSNGNGIYAQATGTTNAAASSGAVYASLTQSVAGNQDVAGVIGIQANIRQGTGGYAGPLAATTNSSLAGVSGTFASREIVTTDAYFFGVIGDVLRDSGVAGSVIPNRSGGVMGFSGTAGTFGMLGYKNSLGVLFGLYGNAAPGAGTGKMASMEPNNGIGIGANGGFMGGFVKGSQYGLVSQGKEFGMYVNGNTITNAPIIQLTENGNKRTATYATTSTSVDVTTRGKAKLTKGEIFVAFSDAFIESVSSSELDKNVESNDAINITITPVGESNGVFIKSITSHGFYVKENARGTSNVSFNWTAIGTKKGYENGVTISNEILANDFEAKMDGVMHNEANTNSKATPIYFDGNKVRFESMPEDRSKMATSIPVKKIESEPKKEETKK